MIKFLLFCCPKLNIDRREHELLIKTEYRNVRKLVVLGMGVCLVLPFASCKSSESAYKKAYEKAKQQELAEPQV